MSSSKGGRGTRDDLVASQSSLWLEKLSSKHAYRASPETALLDGVAG